MHRENMRNKKSSRKTNTAIKRIQLFADVEGINECARANNGEKQLIYDRLKCEWHRFELFDRDDRAFLP